ncbi:MAG: hypothetical protein SVT52_03745 [Planctomycetota bacterium]|nr:hypothetical protein [Planctomycetota bacterium]
MASPVGPPFFSAIIRRQGSQNPLASARLAPGGTGFRTTGVFASSKKDRFPGNLFIYFILDKFYGNSNITTGNRTMKSFRYLFGGRPCNIDDCLDLARKTGAVRVRVRPSSNETVTEMFVQKDFFGDYYWEFSKGSFFCRDFCGCFFMHESAQRRQQHIRQANRKLRRRIDEIRQLGVEVEPYGGNSSGSTDLQWDCKAGKVCVFRFA